MRRVPNNVTAPDEAGVLDRVNRNGARLSWPLRLADYRSIQCGLQSAEGVRSL